MSESQNPEETIFAIHQPNYIPWLGYFHKLAHCDVFVYLDSVQFPRGRSLAARNRIKTSNGPTYLTVPVSTPRGTKGKASYTEIRMAEGAWRQQHLRSLERAYKRASHFAEVFELFQRESEGHDSLAELNIALIDAISRYLGIDTPTVRLSALTSVAGNKTELIVSIGATVGADVYLSGAGGREYNDESLLDRHGIELRYNDFEARPYPQLWGPFEPHLSVLDLMFNCGRGAGDVLKS